MRDLNPAINLIKRHEGLRLKSYQDSGGVWTIGYGHTKDVYPGEIITEQYAEELLALELNAFARHVEQCLTAEVTNNQFCALLDFAYNEGVGRLMGSTLLKLINAGASNIVCSEEFMKWVYQGRTVLPGLIKRRDDERALFLEPDSVAA